MSTLLRLCTVLALLAAPTGAVAQAANDSPREPSGAPVAVLPTILYNDQANLREATDSAQARLGQSVLRERLGALLIGQVRPFSLTDSLARSAEYRPLAGGVACGARVACSLAVARAAGARWAVLSKVSKTSNLIWLLTAQLIHVPDGKIVLDDSTELKGEPALMVKIGMRQFADRAARTVRAGGIATNFPRGEPRFP
jgi:hypothetical protein